MKEGVRVDAITITTARLRPIGWALLRAPDCLGTLTIRSAGPGPGAHAARQTGQNQEICPKNGTQNQKNLFSIGPRPNPSARYRSSRRGARVVNPKGFPCGGICGGQKESNRPRTGVDIIPKKR